MLHNRNEYDSVYMNIQSEGPVLNVIQTNTFYVTTSCIRSLCAKVMTIIPIKTFPAFNGEPTGLTVVTKWVYILSSIASILLQHPSLERGLLIPSHIYASYN
jgi:hypothetical protein